MVVMPRSRESEGSSSEGIRLVHRARAHSFKHRRTTGVQKTPHSWLAVCRLMHTLERHLWVEKGGLVDVESLERVRGRHGVR